MKLIIHLGNLSTVGLLLLLSKGAVSSSLVSSSKGLQQTHDATNLEDSMNRAGLVENLELRSEYKAKKPAKKTDTDCPPVRPNLVTVEVPPPSLADASWIWTNEVQPPNASGTVPAGARPFLKVLHTNCPVDHVTIDITCDNFYTLYVNGKLVGSGKTTYTVTAQRYTVKIASTKLVTVAVYAEQDPVTLGGVGLLASGVAWNSKEAVPREIRFNTDATWKTFPANDFDRKFIEDFFDASRWQKALVLGKNGVAPWGLVAEPTSPTPQNPGLTGISGIPDAPQAKPADVVTLGGKFPTLD